MKIGFFGDSFCAVLDKDRGGFHTNNIWPTYETYIKKLQDHYQADIVNLGIRGSSIYDAILMQIAPFIQEQTVPDVCVFVWTSTDRLFHREVRGVNFKNVLHHSLIKASPRPVWDAAQQYYRYFYDDDHAQFQTKAALYYFDNITLPLFPPSTKIIHLWAFHEMWRYSGEYHYRWTNGLEIRPALDRVSQSGGGRDGGVLTDPAWNHLEGEERNKIVFNWIRDAIDNYSTGKLITHEIPR
jgi:hypothetical protein